MKIPELFAHLSQTGDFEAQSLRGFGRLIQAIEIPGSNNPVNFCYKPSKQGGIYEWRVMVGNALDGDDCGDGLSLGFQYFCPSSSGALDPYGLGRICVARGTIDQAAETGWLLTWEVRAATNDSPTLVIADVNLELYASYWPILLKLDQVFGEGAVLTAIDRKLEKARSFINQRRSMPASS